MKKVGVILLSGGLDSTATAAYAANRGYDLTAITLRYGQTHDREVEAAGRVAAALRLRHETVDVAF
ncbi:MAG: 7-cyano-7-deazaguanine synthase, partial [Chloroflexi bacterium]|nr:7-cyano-7-deazaguanine synthase [Chloroflexota bacterium]